MWLIKTIIFILFLAFMLGAGQAFKDWQESTEAKSSGLYDIYIKEVSK